MNAGSGGGLPLVAALADTFPSAELLLTGVADPESRAHSENESVISPNSGIAASMRRYCSVSWPAKLRHDHQLRSFVISTRWAEGVVWPDDGGEASGASSRPFLPSVARARNT